MSRSRRPRKISGRHEDILLNEVKNDPKIHAPKIVAEMTNADVSVFVRRIYNKQGYNRHVAWKCFVSEINEKKRNQFAKTYFNKDVDFWEQVIFSDDSKFTVFWFCRQTNGVAEEKHRDELDKSVGNH